MEICVWRIVGRLIVCLGNCVDGELCVWRFVCFEICVLGECVDGELCVTLKPIADSTYFQQNVGGTNDCLLLGIWLL